MRRILLALLMVGVLGACGGSDDGGGGESPTAQESADAAESLTVIDSAPPWRLGDQQAQRMRAAGVPLLKSEGTKVHYHAHLDVFYDGERVVVPANIGIDLDERVISPLHTHTASGVIHVEANEAEDFTLGQLLTEWGVKTSDGCIADKCGNEVAVFVDGSIQDVFAADLVIGTRDQITLVLGTEPPEIPSEYDCAAEDPGDLCD